MEGEFGPNISGAEYSQKAVGYRSLTRSTLSTRVCAMPRPMPIVSMFGLLLAVACGGEGRGGSPSADGGLHVALLTAGPVSDDFRGIGAAWLERKMLVRFEKVPALIGVPVPVDLREYLAFAAEGASRVGTNTANCQSHVAVRTW